MNTKMKPIERVRAQQMLATKNRIIQMQAEWNTAWRMALNDDGRYLTPVKPKSLFQKFKELFT